MQKSIKVEQKTWDLLMRLKLDGRYKSVDEVIVSLAETSKTAKPTKPTFKGKPIAFEVLPNAKPTEEEIEAGLG